MENKGYQKFYRRKIPELLIAKKYVNDFAEIELTQQIDVNPIIYKGPGSIFQDDSGILMLKVYHVYTKSNPPKFSHHKGNVGEFIGKEHYFHLKATDMSGEEWFAKDVWVSANITIPSAGTVIEMPLEEIEFIKISENSDQFDIELMAIGKYDTPHSEFITFPDGSTSRSKHSILLDDITISTINTGTSLYVQIAGNDQFYSEDIFALVIEAIGVAIGRKIHVSTISTKALGKTCLKIKNRDLNSDSILNPPIPAYSPLDGENFSDFIKKYIAAFKKPWCVFYMNWYKIHRSADTTIENTALIQCVVIEGVLKEYYSTYGVPVEIAEIDKAILIVDESNLEPEMKKRIANLISSMKNQNPRRALKELKEKGWITDKMQEAWNQRQTLAHGKIISAGGMIEMQKVLDDSNTVLSLFYRLLLIHIGYSEKFYDYSSEKWPIVSMSDIVVSTEKQGKH